MTLRLATRSSSLAITQCRAVEALLQRAGLAAETVPIGPTESPAPTGGEDKGRFTHGVESAVRDGRADIGVHSAKDLPGRGTEDLALAGAPRRGPASEAWVTAPTCREPDGAGLAARLAALPAAARIGTASIRRRSQLLALRPDLEVVELRGNVETRLRLLEERELDAIVLATAGLQRLGLSAAVEFEIEIEEMVPPPGQGTLALQIRPDDAEAGNAIEAITCSETFAALRAERAVAAALEADCDTPVGAFANLSATGEMSLVGYVGRADGGDWIKDRVAGSTGSPEALGARLGDRLIASGAQDILRPG